MRHSVRVLGVGVLLIVGGLITDVVGAQYQLLGVIVLAFGLAIAGAVVAMRWMLEFLGEQFSSRASKRPNVQNGPP